MALNLQVDRALDKTAQSVNDQSGNTTSLALSTDSVGMGTTTPDARLTLQSGSGNVLTTKDHVGTTRFALHSNHAKPFFHELNSHNYNLRLSSFSAGGSGGNIEFHTGIDTPSIAVQIDVGGNVTVTGDVRLAGADCAEEFQIEEGQMLEPGTVVVIGNSETLSECKDAYDTRVAGVLSGAGDYKPGIILGRGLPDHRRIPLALNGKVYCKVDARCGSIRVGDLLTTSATPGHAMKATEPMKAFGAILGKALRPLVDGTGMIPVLVALQ